MIPARKEKSSVFHTAKVKAYPSGNIEILACNRPVFKEPGYEPVEFSRPAVKMQRTQKSSNSSPENLKRSARRAAAMIRDYALCNHFTHFVTLTLNDDIINRYDIAEIVKRLNVWLNNQVKRKGLIYILVPECHKDGAIHFHGLFNDALCFVDSGTWVVPGKSKPVRPMSSADLERFENSGDDLGFHRVFNIPDWKFGFSTAIHLYGNYNGAIAYTCKYIKKQMDSGKIGGRWYLSGGGLRVPDVSLEDISLLDLLDCGENVYTFDVPEARLLFGLLRKNSDPEV